MLWFSIRFVDEVRVRHWIYCRGLLDESVEELSAALRFSTIACRGQRAWPIGRGELMECSSCHRQISVTAGTIFERTRKPLLMWFRAMWWVTNQKTGVSALGLNPLDHDPVGWIFPQGRYNRDRWKRAWSQLFTDHELVHNVRTTVRIVVSPEGDGAFAVVDVDTLWKHRTTGQRFHWKGRACKGSHGLPANGDSSSIPVCLTTPFRRHRNT